MKPFLLKIFLGFFLLIFCLLPASSFAALSQEETDRLFAQMLLEIEVAAKTAEVEIEKLPSLVDDERSRIKNALDQWANTSLTRIVEKNYREVEQALLETNLPQEEGTFTVWWKQTKAGAGSNEDLKKLVELFFADLQPRLSSVSEKFQREILDSLEEETQTHLTDSMEKIRKPFLGILKQRLPVYNTIPVPNTDRAAMSYGTSGKKNGLSEGSIPMKGLVGVAFVLLGRRIITKIMKFLVIKIAGKVLAKLVPVIGWALLAFEVYDMTGARDRLEEEMRKSFLEEYKAEISAETLWWRGENGSGPSMREEVDRNIGSLLNNWERICRSEADSMIQSAHILSFSEEVREYVSKQIRDGSEFEPVLQKMSILWDVFGQLLAQGQVQVFESMLVAAPDRNDLRLLSKSLGQKLPELYKKYGRDFLQAVSKIGVQNYLSSEEWSRGEIDWHLLNENLLFLPELGDNREAAAGLLTLVLEGAPVRGLSPDTLASLAGQKELFRKIWQILRPDMNKTLLLLANKRASAHIGESLELYPAAVAVFLKSYGAEFWSAWSLEEIVDLLQITDFRSVNSGKSHEAALVPPEDRAELINIFRKAGKPGLTLWDIYATEGTGAVGKNLARESVECLADGYAFEDLTEKDGLEFAVVCRKIPLVGKFFYNTFKNLGFLPRLLVSLAGILSILALFFFFFRRKK